MNQKKTTCNKEEADENEFAKVDCALQSLYGHKRYVDVVQEHQRELDLCIQDLEEVL